VRRQRPDLAVVDIRMPPKHSTEGLEAARVLPMTWALDVWPVVRSSRF
jgi:CheY-like chemotaxis protein